MPNMLICTVGTSLFQPNLERLKADMDAGTVEERYVPLARAYSAGRDEDVAMQLLKLSGDDRVCGAEINSITDMVRKGYVEDKCGLFFMHSATNDGRRIGTILKAYFGKHGFRPVETVEIEDLQDQDPRRFRTRGLRNLARHICKVVRERSAQACAINATGGYKAQIAIAVLLGQAIGIPVFYKHERFPEIIAFPPMPVALDYELWMRASGMLFALEKTTAAMPFQLFEPEWDERYESLVERVQIDGRDYIELSPTGQIFHETFRERFRTSRDQVLPPPVPAGQKRTPRLEKAGWPGEHPEVLRFLEQVTSLPWVVQCETFYFNPDLPEQTRFRMGAKSIEGVFSNGTYCVKFRVETSAQNEGQRNAVVAALNEWLNGGDG